MMKIIKAKCRPAAVAGSFYPKNVNQLKKAIINCLKDASVPQNYRQPTAIIVPHAGLVYSGKVAAQAYRRLNNLVGQINSVILIGPSHHIAFKGVGCSSSDYFQTPLGRVRLDKITAENLCNHPLVNVQDKAHQYEHSLEVQLPFLQTVLRNFRLLPLLIGDINQEEMLSIFEKIVQNRRPLANQLIIISSDLSHYLTDGKAKKQDAETIQNIMCFKSNAINGKDACGYKVLNGFLQFAKNNHYQIEQLSVKNSAEAHGKKDRVVGYASFALYKQQGAFSNKQKETLLKIAKDSILEGFKTAQPLNTNHLKTDPKLQKNLACFVTLTINGQLRGCIGTLYAKRTLIEDIAKNAFLAAFQDRRFSPLTQEELEKTDISIAVLSPVTPIHYENILDLKSQINVGVDGLILQEQQHKATFLPSVWQQIPDVDTFLERLKQKAGLKKQYWSKTLQISKYTTENF